MIISYQGIQSFKVQFGDTVLAFNPVSKASKFKAGSFGADVALITNNHPDMNGADQASRGDKEAFVVNGPGEYEVRGVFIKGVLSNTKYGGSESINTIYSVNLEGINICFLGSLVDSNLGGEAKESLDGIDILFVPIGGIGVMDASLAYKLAVSLEPSIIIPMHFSIGGGYEVGEKDALKKFLKEAGSEGLKSVDKLTIKKKDLEGKEAEVVVLSSE